MTSVQCLSSTITKSDFSLFFSMVSLKLCQTSSSFHTTLSSLFSPSRPLPLPTLSRRPKEFGFKLESISSSASPSFSLLSFSRPFFTLKVSEFPATVYENEEETPQNASEFEDLSENGVVYKKTLAIVECSMFAALTGLVYFLSNSLGLENYFGCFFALPIVIASMRWGIAAGRKTMVATFLLLLILSGPVKALTYLLKHGIVGFTMGSLWRSGTNWNLSILLCTIVRASGAVGYVLISSYLIRENILALITINIHASLTFMFTASGINTIPSMNMIYIIFGTLVMINCGCFMFLLHLLYSVFFTRLGMRASLTLPRWLDRAI